LQTGKENAIVSEDATGKAGDEARVATPHPPTISLLKTRKI